MIVMGLTFQALGNGVHVLCCICEHAIPQTNIPSTLFQHTQALKIGQQAKGEGTELDTAP